MAELQFSDEEVAAIFEKASEAESLAPLSAGKGMTLAALQDIGREAGMSPEAIERAAHSLDQTARSKPQTLLGLPVAVGQTIEVDRPLAEADWERLVADLRMGIFRRWLNRRRRDLRFIGFRGNAGEFRLEIPDDLETKSNR